jgi:Predicted nucleotide-binding protein containing TIR-like domain
MENSEKPNLFIGSSRESLGAARDIEYNLKDDANVTIWDQGVFGVGSTILGELERIAEAQDFAVLVFAADDKITSHGQVTAATRDNVIFELGFFYGRLGPDRTFIVRPKSSVKVPSDLFGVIVSLYDDTRPERRSALSPACTEIRDRLSLGRKMNRPIRNLDPKNLSAVERRILELVVASQNSPKKGAAFFPIQRELSEIDPDYRTTLLGLQAKGILEWTDYFDPNPRPGHENGGSYPILRLTDIGISLVIGL